MVKNPCGEMWGFNSARKSLFLLHQLIFISCVRKVIMKAIVTFFVCLSAWSQ